MGLLLLEAGHAHHERHHHHAAPEAHESAEAARGEADEEALLERNGRGGRAQHGHAS